MRKRGGKFERSVRSDSPPEPVEARLLLLVAALLLPVLLLEVGVEPVRPLADAANVKREVPRLLGRRRYREWMPFAGKRSQNFSEMPDSILKFGLEKKIE